MTDTTHNDFYDEWKESRLFELVIDLNIYCRAEAPTLLKYSDNSDFIDLLDKYIHIKNPFILIDDSESDEETYTSDEYSS